MSNIKINWSIRFKNKTWLLSFMALIITFVYQTLGMFEIVPPVTQDMLVQLSMAFINILVAVGVIIDPTTKGLNDSDKAIKYDKPN